MPHGSLALVGGFRKGRTGAINCKKIPGEHPPWLRAGGFMPSLTRMKYRRFGRTELAMPVISCGGMRYQFKWQDVAPGEIPAESQANLEATIHRAIELGINHIETA